MPTIEQRIFPVDPAQLERFAPDVSRPMFLAHLVLMNTDTPGLAALVTQVGERLPDPEAQGEPSTTRLDFYEGAGATHLVLDKACDLYTPKPVLMRGVDLMLGALIHESSPLRPHEREAMPLIDILSDAFKPIYNAEPDVANVIEGFASRFEYSESSRKAFIAGSGFLLAAVREEMRRTKRGW